MAFREACWNLGATRWQTIRTVVLPNSLSGMLTGVILEICRCAGETAPILFTGATFFKFIADDGWEKILPYNLGEPFMALSMHLHVISNQISQMPDVDEIRLRRRDDRADPLHQQLRHRPARLAARPQTLVAMHDGAAAHRISKTSRAFYGRKQVLQGRELHRGPQRSPRHHRPGEFRQDHDAQDRQSHARFRRTARASPAMSCISGESVAAMRDPNALRRRIGMVFPLPVGLPLTVYENVAFAPRRQGITTKAELDEIVERCLRQSVLWDEVKDRLELARHPPLRRPAAAPHPRPRALAFARDSVPR